MSKISAMMDIGKRSMMNSQTALQTVSHNIANKTTEGYSRQRVDLQTAPPVGSGNLRYGMGARAADVGRVNNPYLEKQLLAEGSELGYAEARANALSRVEEVYNEQINRGLNKYVGDFFNAFRELAASPENLASRTLVKETAINLTKDFKRVSNQLKEITGDLNAQMKSNVATINEITEEIATLNKKVQSVEISGAKANDERDRRDLLLKKLAEKINIKWSEGDHGLVTVTAANSALLVSGHDHAELVAKEMPNLQNRKGEELRIFFKLKEDLPMSDMTPQIKGGSLGALLEVRDRVVSDLLNDIDEMAFEFKNEVNAIHKQGFNRYNHPGDDFFVVDNQFDAADRIEVNERVRADVGQIATAAAPNSPGDNRIANVMANLQYKNVMRGGSSTVDQFYNGMVGKVGVASDQAGNRLDSQKGIVTQLNNLRESVSGVSLDEETTKMIEFQKTFDASARMIRTADEMLETVLNIKR